MRRRGVLAIGAVLVLAACGGGDDDASSGSSGDGDSPAVVTCEVLTADVVGDALGTDVIAETMTTPSGGTDPVGCSYTSDSGDLRVLATARFGEKYYGGIDSPARTDPVAIVGLGDEAFADDGMVTFLSGEWTGSVSSSAGNVPDDDLEAVARALESKLP